MNEFDNNCCCRLCRCACEHRHENMYEQQQNGGGEQRHDNCGQRHDNCCRQQHENCCCEKRKCECRPIVRTCSLCDCVRRLFCCGR